MTLSLDKIELVMPDPDVYDIRINNLQRQLLYKALNHMCASLQGTSWLNADELEVCKDMRAMLDPDPSEGEPLAPKGVINSFVI